MKCFLVANYKTGERGRLLKKAKFGHKRGRRAKIRSVQRHIEDCDLGKERIMALLASLRRTGGIGLRRGGLFAREIQSFSLPELPYEYSALEPVISGEIMSLHHQKHHQAYVTNYNKALEQLEVASANKNTEAIVSLQSAIKFNGGGHINHSVFWKNLAPVKEGGGEAPSGGLAKAIDTQFGSLNALIEKMNAVGAALQGSGWVWLGLNKDLKSLFVETTPNQDPLVTKGLLPLLGIDVWEHAYYLQYKNVRPDYLKNIWKVINWKYAEGVYEKEAKP